jgi:class 3 adenylate cyclase
MFSSRERSRISNGPDAMGASLQLHAKREVITATIAFINIPRLKLLPHTTAYRAVLGLHRALRQCLGPEMGTRLDVLSALTGAIVVVPDSSSLYIHERLTQLGRGWVAKGIPVRVGVAHGEIEILSDVDHMMNAIGEPLNIAARLATLKAGSGCILHRSYLDSMGSAIDNASFLVGSRKVELAGKVHDTQVMAGRRIDAPAFPRMESIDDDLLPKIRRAPSTINGVALGYDLPQFSAGDRSALSKRFRSITDVFDTLRSEQRLDSSSPIYFSPGGDGGVLLVKATKQEGFMLAERLTRLLNLESADRDKKIQVVTRIGVHYGAVTLYENASRVLRPTGPVCFIADAVASDQKPGDAAFRGVVITEAFVDAAGDGSRELFACDFEELPSLPKGPAKGIRRFVRRGERNLSKDPLFARLTSGPGSWEPVR